ncbi:ArsR/SmtB family transcription factor [Cellulosimicrobium arenosum]|uniref:Helix-turn-helix domain-containing protein n=1 Tax=Cellulosimicrobium arenosum TaxID=2708133 RepID=A0A927J1N6_9MICO|nr:helix-turn-helix domain-containing protein [Cellulosimicrobium arenosum]MBD8080276.1 helix-turn-helix domain-containing protein [Cellulosimicrobium arenosum]
MSTDDTAGPGREKPSERILGPAQLKALAHPLRIEILEQLTAHGALTASGLAELVGESSGSTSYHLRQLARHGFVRDVPGRGTARERWWERNPGGFVVSLPDDPDDVASVATTQTVNREFERARARRILALIENPTSVGREWLDVTRFQTTNLWLTTDQAAEVTTAWDRFSEVLDRYSNQQDHPGARPVQVHFNLFPLVEGKENPS